MDGSYKQKINRAAEVLNDTISHKTSLNIFKKIETISSIFSDHNGMKLKINYMKKNLENSQICGDETTCY